MATNLHETRTGENTTILRPDVRSKTWWGSAATAGIIAGIVFAMMEMFLVWAVMGASFWAPLQMIAAMVMGPQVLPTTASITFGIGLIGLFIHLVFSVLYGLIIGWIVHKMDMGTALLVGGLFGLIAIYFINFYLIAPAVFPWFVAVRNWISLVSHVAFGLVAAGVYISMRNKRERDTAVAVVGR